jgi:hypothetical protein
MPFTPDLATKLVEKITANTELMEQLRSKIFEQIKESNRTGVPYSKAEDTLAEMEKVSSRIEIDYKHLEAETLWAPEVA